jgi:GntR family transcriptional repressor for pyruvate dehydrogenase complex
MGKKFDPIGNRELLSKTVASTIEDAIRVKELVPGTRLPSELELCQQFDVSRTAIREALRTLEAKGLITIEKGRGIFVKLASADDVTDPMHLYLELTSERSYVLEIIHARQIIEPAIASFAAIHHTEEDIEKLKLDIKELEESGDDFKALAKLDMNFHIDIAKASQNPLMPLLLNPIHRLMPDIKSSVYATVEKAKDSALIWHRKILDQIIKRDAEGAKNAMIEHLKIAEEHVETMLKAQKQEEAVEKVFKIL